MKIVDRLGITDPIQMKNDQNYLVIIRREGDHLVVDEDSRHLFEGESSSYQLSIRGITPLPKDEKEES